MTKLPDLREQRAMHVAELRTLATKETLGDEERRRFDTLEAEIRKIDDRIRRAEAIDELERRATGTRITEGGSAPDLSRYSIAKATRESMNGALSGLEREVHDELSRGREVRGFMVPTEILLGGEQRVGQATAPSDVGGYLVPTMLRPVADRRRPRLWVEALGATVLNGLVGTVELPNLTASGSAHWVGEEQAPTRSAATFGVVSMFGRTVAAEYAISRRLILQSNESIENIVRMDGGQLLAQALDAAAINGSGVLEPLGILNWTGVGPAVSNGTNFWDTTADLMSALETENVTGTAAFLTTPGVMNLARKVLDAEDRMVGIEKVFHGQRVESSTQVPTNLSTDKHALIYGEWASLYLGYWSAVDVLANPYHSDVASAGGVLMHFFLDADVAVREEKAFAFSEIDVTP